jgi:sortase A
VKVLRVLLLLLLIAGGCLTSRAVYLHAKSGLAGVLIRRAWQESVKNGEPRPPWPWADTHPVARLRIPRLGYDEIVLDAATPRTLAFGPARLLSGAALGGPGNLVIAGHRTSWFRPIEALAAGDSMELQWFDAHRGRLLERTYTVTAIRVVPPQEVSLLALTPDDALTLVTCYPFGRSPRSPLRFLVLASPAGPSRPAQISSARANPSRDPARIPTVTAQLPEQPGH